VRQQILGGAQQIASVTGKDPAPLFRFPFDDTDARTIAIANQAGYVPVRWTVDSLGWEGTAGKISASVVVSRYWPRLGRARSSSCTSAPTPTITPRSTPRCPR
jgi:peptidoglycan/xylan/chitin deacetylase (PgdA/CDA1 family)